MHTIDTHEFIESVLKAKNEKQKIEIIAKTIDESQKNSIEHLATKEDILALENRLLVKLPIIVSFIIALFVLVVDKLVG